MCVGIGILHGEEATEGEYVVAIYVRAALGASARGHGVGETAGQRVEMNEPQLSAVLGDIDCERDREHDGVVVVQGIDANCEPVAALRVGHPGDAQLGDRDLVGVVAAVERGCAHDAEAFVEVGRGSVAGQQARRKQRR